MNTSHDSDPIVIKEVVEDIFFLFGYVCQYLYVGDYFIPLPDDVVIILLFFSNSQHLRSSANFFAKRKEFTFITQKPFNFSCLSFIFNYRASLFACSTSIYVIQNLLPKGYFQERECSATRGLSRWDESINIYP